MRDTARDQSTMSRLSWVLGLVYGMRGVMGGYMNVEMEQATQCGHSVVSWSGDQGPYHLLLTPTEHVEHGYNVWLPSLPNGTSSYNISINQPQGLQYVVTVWGASGVAYAGTTDVLTVGPPTTNRSCFLTDEEILGLYSFSFNISDTSEGYPPQCSNLTMSWPTSLESNITGPTTTKRQDSNGGDNAFNETSETDSPMPELDSSSSDHRGNTTYPPSMFGVIPLGNSFSIPITYDLTSKYAKYLPNSSRSSDPTTWTTQGVTYLNWTVPLAKGTRFILVAGIGSDQQWASGGSSALLTVGQGTTTCGWTENSGGDSEPSVTATTGTYTPTEGVTGVPADNGDNSTSGSSSGPKTVVKTILACVLSVLGTLLVVGIFFWCRRTRRNRRDAVHQAFIYPDSSPPKSARGGNDPFNPSSMDLPLDLIASRDGARSVPPIDTNTHHDRVDSPVEMSPMGTHSSSGRLMFGMTPPHTGTVNSYGSPISPTHGRQPYLGDVGRQSSLDPLISTFFSGPARESSSPTGDSGGGTVSTHRPLRLHDRSVDMPYEDEDEDVPELKRETLAMSGGAGPSGRPAGAPVPRRRRRDEDLEYVVHRDAGRVQNAQNDNRRVLELPPRYEELDWEQEEAVRASEGNEGSFLGHSSDGGHHAR